MICVIALLWLAAIFWAPPSLWRFVPTVPVFLAPLWIKVLCSRLGSFGIAQSKLILFAWMSTVFGVCLLVLYEVPKGMLLAPLAFVFIHVPLFFNKHRAIDLSKSTNSAPSDKHE
jgi:hypothetical protein